MRPSRRGNRSPIRGKMKSNRGRFPMSQKLNSTRGRFPVSQKLKSTRARYPVHRRLNLDRERSLSRSNTYRHSARGRPTPERRRPERVITSYNDVERPPSTEMENSLTIFSNDNHSSNNILPSPNYHHGGVLDENFESRNDLPSCSWGSPGENRRKVEVYRQEEHRKIDEDNRTGERLMINDDIAYERNDSYLDHFSPGFEEPAKQYNYLRDYGENDRKENRFGGYCDREMDNDEYHGDRPRQHITRKESFERFQDECRRREIRSRLCYDNAEDRKENERYNDNQENMDREMSYRHIERSEVEGLDRRHGKPRSKRNERNYDGRINFHTEDYSMERMNQPHVDGKMENRKEDGFAIKSHDKDTMKRKQEKKKNKHDSHKHTERGLRKREEKHRPISYRHFSKLPVKEKSNIVSDILSVCIQSNNERLPLQQLRNLIKTNKRLEFEHESDLRELLKEYTKCFVIDFNATVTGTTNVDVCFESCDCGKLHLCKYDLRNDCRFGNSCKLGHALHTEKNATILENHCLHKLTDNEIKTLIKFVGHCPVPSLCVYYRKGDCNKWRECTRLHLCLNFIKEDCRYGSSCNRSHDLRSGRNGEILQQYGLYQKDDRTLLKLIRGTLDENGNIKVDLKPPSATKVNEFESKKRKLGDNCSNGLAPTNKKIKMVTQNKSWKKSDLQTKLNVDHNEKDKGPGRATITETDVSGTESDKGRQRSDSNDHRDIQQTLHSLDFIPLSVTSSDFTMENGDINQAEDDDKNTRDAPIKVSVDDKKQSVFIHHLINTTKKLSCNDVLNANVSSISEREPEDESNCSASSPRDTKTGLPENGQDVVNVEETNPQFENKSEQADELSDAKLNYTSEDKEYSESIKDEVEGKTDVDKTGTIDSTDLKDEINAISGSIFEDTSIQDSEQSLTVSAAVADADDVNLPDNSPIADLQELNADEKKDSIEPCTPPNSDACLYDKEAGQIDIKMNVGSEEYIMKVTKDHMELKSGIYFESFTDESWIQLAYRLLEFCKQNKK